MLRNAVGREEGRRGGGEEGVGGKIEGGVRYRLFQRYEGVWDHFTSVTRGSNFQKKALGNI